MCDFVQDTHVMPGYACCRCGVYNGLQRHLCRSCGQAPHPFPILETVKQCPTCDAGYPNDFPVKCMACGTELGGTEDLQTIESLLNPIKLQ